MDEEEANEIKQKLISHVESTFPEEQIPAAVSQIESMNSEQLESFLKKNNLVGDSEEDKEEETGKCVFCSIVADKIKSVRIGENNGAIAILEINPISKGHALVILKEHTDKPERDAMVLAKEIARKIKKKFRPKRIEISESKTFGHDIINLLPVYKDENFSSPRSSAKIDDLEMIREELEKEVQKVRKPRMKKVKEFFWLPKRIP
jgi:histidine triad (HIT) family protein